VILALCKLLIFCVLCFMFCALDVVRFVQLLSFNSILYF
jgi:hypothetical protein